eukprot:ctg_1473.g391
MASGADHRAAAVVADIGLIGLAVMGQNLVLNMADHGYTVAVYNRTVSRVDRFVADEAAGNARVIGMHSVGELCERLRRPRKVMLLVKAGAPVDAFIEQLRPHLDPGDIIVDGGNSHFRDSSRRMKECAEQGRLLFVGCGVSGGEEGARHGPSLMPGGNPEAWPALRPILQAIAAHTDGEPCCEWVGEGGAGHFVKMVHNGIEYGDMQLISEAFDILHRGLGLSIDECSVVFARWNSGELDSYLIEITANILRAPVGGPWSRRWTQRACHPDRRGGVRAHAVLDEGGAAARQQDVARTGAGAVARRPRAGDADRERPASAVRQQDRVVRARLHVNAGSGARRELEPQLRRYRVDVARRLHYSQPLSRQNTRCLPRRSGAGESVAQPLLRRGGTRRAIALALGGGVCGRPRHPVSGIQHRVGVLRRVPRTVATPFAACRAPWACAPGTTAASPAAATDARHRTLGWAPVGAAPPPVGTADARFDTVARVQAQRQSTIAGLGRTRVPDDPGCGCAHSTAPSCSGSGRRWARAAVTTAVAARRWCQSRPTPVVSTPSAGRRRWPDPTPPVRAPRPPRPPPSSPQRYRVAHRRCRHPLYRSGRRHRFAGGCGAHPARRRCSRHPRPRPPAPPANAPCTRGTVAWPVPCSLRSAPARSTRPPPRPTTRSTPQSAPGTRAAAHRSPAPPPRCAHRTAVGHRTPAP